MSLEQKMEIAIRNAPLSEGLRRELGDIKTLVATFVVVTGALLALAATGFGAAAEAIAIGFLLAGAVASGAQIGRGINGLIAFYRQADAATTEEDLNRAGISFADGVAALGIGALFLLLTFLGARTRGAGSGGGAAEDSAKVSAARQTGGEPPLKPNEPTKVTRRIPEKASSLPKEEPATSSSGSNAIAKAPLSNSEMAIARDARSLMSSPQFAELRTAVAEGRPAEAQIGKYFVQVEPDMPASAMTWAERNGFTMGKEAWTSDEETTKTVLHELYRLNTSQSIGNEVDAASASAETKAAASFADRAWELFK